MMSARTGLLLIRWFKIQHLRVLGIVHREVGPRVLPDDTVCTVMIDLLLHVPLVFGLEARVSNFLTLDVDVRTLINDLRAIIVVGLRCVCLEGAMTGQDYGGLIFEPRLVYNLRTLPLITRKFRVLLDDSDASRVSMLLLQSWLGLIVIVRLGKTVTDLHYVVFRYIDSLKELRLVFHGRGCGLETDGVLKLCVVFLEMLLERWHLYDLLGVWSTSWVHL